jgi:hypothetical protein
LREQWNGLAKLDEQIANIERRMREWKKEDKAVKAISEIPGVGLLTAPVAAAMGVDEIWGRLVWSKLQQLTYWGDGHGTAMEDSSATAGNGRTSVNLLL